MRVLTVVETLGPGGTQRVAQNYTLGYKRLGHEVAVLAHGAGGPREAVLREADVSMFIGNGDESSRNAAADQAAAWRPEVIHIHRRGVTDALTGGLLRRLKAGVDSRTVVLETNVFARPDYSTDRELIDVHLLLTRWCLWKWSCWSRGLVPAPIGVVIPNMIDVDAFAPASDEQAGDFRDEFGISRDAFLFGRVGQPNESKWSPIVLHAFTRFALASPQAHLLLVGLPPAYQKYLDTMPGDVRRRVIQIPFLHGDERLKQCYTAMDVMLHAAQIGESFGLVLVEAVLCGCPTITLSTPAKDNSQLEVVGHERGGLVVGDTASMVRAMQRLTQDDALRQRLAVDGAVWARQQYAIDASMPRLVRVAELALAADSRETLRETIQSDESLTTKVSVAEIAKLQRRMHGTPPLADRVLARLVHVPAIYRQWSIVSKWVRGR